MAGDDDYGVCTHSRLILYPGVSVVETGFDRRGVLFATFCTDNQILFRHVLFSCPGPAVYWKIHSLCRYPAPSCHISVGSNMNVRLLTAGCGDL